MSTTAEARPRATPVMLPGSRLDDGALRQCGGQCGEDVTPGGGVQLTAKRWICSSCWKRRQLAIRNRAL